MITVLVQSSDLLSFWSLKVTWSFEAKHWGFNFEFGCAHDDLLQYVYRSGGGGVAITHVYLGF